MNIREVVETVVREVLGKEIIIAANWKMNKTTLEGKNFLNELGEITTNNEVIIFPPFTSLEALSSDFMKQGIKFGPQNIHHKDFGAFTGEISVAMIKQFGCQYVLLGHSERREYFEETDELINQKVAQCLTHSLKPMICIGENLEERNKNRWKSVLEMQITRALDKIPENQLCNILLAYEPIWAIGSGNSASVLDIKETHTFIKEVLKSNYNTTLPILYGGSVNEKNVKSIASIPYVDGFLIGGASLESESFKNIIINATR